MAKKPKIDLTIGLDGEKEFNDALDKIDAGLRVNASQMKLVQATYEDEGKSVRDLTRAQEALEAKIASQTEKVMVLEAALKNSVDKTGESSEKTMEWQKKLNYAKASLAKMNTALEENQEAMARAQKGTTSLTDAINGIASAAGISVPPAIQGMVDKLDGVSASGAALVGVTAGIVATLGKMTIETAKTADNIMTLSTVTGLSTDALQEFEYASELLDVSTDTMTGSLSRMVASMRTAREGSQEAARAYQQLRIRLTDSNGQLRDANTVFYEVIDALGKVRNETERDSIAMKIFGESAKTLNPLIESGSERLRELADEAHQMGYVMDNETLGSFVELSDAMERLEKQGDALQNSLAVALLPVLTGLFEAIAAIPAPVLQTVVVLASVVATIVLAVKAIKEMTSTAGAITQFFSGFDFAANKTTIIILGVVAAVTALAVAIVTLTGRAQEFQNSMSSVNSSMNQMRSASASVPRYARGTTYHPGGLATINDGGGYPGETVLLPRGSRVYPASQQRGGDTFNFTVDAKNIRELNDLVRIAENARQSQRMGYVKQY